MSILRIVKVGVGAAGFCAALFAAGPAAAGISLILQPTGTGPWDWTLTGPIWKFDQGTDPAPYSTMYAKWSGISWSPGAPHCIELATQPGLQTSNPDTRIWVQTEMSTDGTGSPSTPSTYPGKTTRNGFTSVNDDFGGTLQSKVRIWIDRGSSTSNVLYNFKIAAYSSTHNNADFRVSTTRLDISKAACTTTQSIPWVIAASKPYYLGGTYQNIELSANAN